MDNSLIIIATVFVAATSLVVGLGLLLGGSKSEPTTVGANSATGAGGTLFNDDELFDEEAPDSSFLGFFMPSNRQGRREIAERIMQAGLYKRNSMIAYLTGKAILALTPLGLGLATYALGMVTLPWALVYGGTAAAFGTLLPSFWLDAQLRKRQKEMRRALPDALDVITVCLEGGLSLPAALSKVSTELKGVHALLAMEMAIVHRETQMGKSNGEALKSLAKRFDLEELRSLASVVLQAEKFGSSLVRAFRIQSDALREQRMQRAEEKAQRASLLIMLPTLICIFPALFVVLLGPAAFNVYETFSNL
ncbi:type II secretion system F family protein [Roseiconus nitratireducens]|uniref:Type II secretion system F family protein n=1 Tax=Roseiconus nitratireducens TaxID=2605748 RepID=A0A5M6D830_9BACT|nr:type II secretion system F family protein [Roseiconus nitratireducens]KAA5541335.1 type II secretion system F family protein [Roseiconus nitratireducens]